MKRILYFASLISATGPSAFSQTAGVYTIPLAASTVAAATTVSPGKTLNVSEYNSVGLQLTAAASGAATSIVTFSFSKSLDGTTYETTPSQVITLTLNGTTPVVVVSELSIPSTATIKLVSIANTNAGVTLSGVDVKWRVKPNGVRQK